MVNKLEFTISQIWKQIVVSTFCMRYISNETNVAYFCLKTIVHRDSKLPFETNTLSLVYIIAIIEKVSHFNTGT